MSLALVRPGPRSWTLLWWGGGNPYNSACDLRTDSAPLQPRLLRIVVFCQKNASREKFVSPFGEFLAPDSLCGTTFGTGLFRKYNRWVTFRDPKPDPLAPKNLYYYLLKMWKIKDFGGFWSSEVPQSCLRVQLVTSSSLFVSIFHLHFSRPQFQPILIFTLHWYRSLPAIPGAFCSIPIPLLNVSIGIRGSGK